MTVGLGGSAIKHKVKVETNHVALVSGGNMKYINEVWIFSNIQSILNWTQLLTKECGSMGLVWVSACTIPICKQKGPLS